MKYLILFLTIVITGSTYSQTKLIKHKSHSGTNSNFLPTDIEGNFGEIFISMEIEKDNTSSYKLISENRGRTYILFKRKNKSDENTMCMSQDYIIEQITVAGQSEIRENIEELLISQLRELRSKEKE